MAILTEPRSDVWLYQSRYFSKRGGVVSASNSLRFPYRAFLRVLRGDFAPVCAVQFAAQVTEFHHGSDCSLHHGRCCSRTVTSDVCYDFGKSAERTCHLVLLRRCSDRRTGTLAGAAKVDEEHGVTWVTYCAGKRQRQLTGGVSEAGAVGPKSRRSCHAYADPLHSGCG